MQTKNIDNKHNGIISFWKFLFCIMIVIFHSRTFFHTNETIIFSKGSIAVEFFFLVSGFLMAKKALSKNEKINNLGEETKNFILKKVKAFLPYVIVGGILGLITNNLYNSPTIKDNILSIWDILLLRMTGLKATPVNGATWYISSMLLSMLILYPLLRKYKLNFIYLIAPLIILFGFGWLNHNYGSLRAPEVWLGFTYKGNIRAFLELTLGATLYVGCEQLKKVKFTNIGSICLTIIEIIGFIIPFVMSQVMEKATRYDYIVLIFLSVSIMIAFTGKTKEYNLLNNKVSYYLERLSLSLYIFHYPVKTFVKHSSLFKGMNYYQMLIIYLVLAIIISIIIMHILDYLKKNNYFLNKIKPIFIES